MHTAAQWCTKGPPGRVRKKLVHIRGPLRERERVLFIGTQFSNLYTVVDTPARGRVSVVYWYSFSNLYTAVHTPARGRVVW